jgi:hypothetical protein
MRDDVVKLCEWMRAHGVIQARVGDVELTLGPEVIRVPEEGPMGESLPDEPSDIYADPDLWMDGVPPTLDGHAPKTPKTSSEDSAMAE